MSRARAVLVMVALTGCAGRDATPQAAPEDLPEGAAARVGDEIIGVETVQRVARAQGVGLVLARERLISDALLAIEARTIPWRARSAERSALARAMLDELEARARAETLPSDADVQRVTADRWWEFDRPASARTAHVVVLVKTPSQEPEARAVADAIASAVHGAAEPRDFLARASTVPHGELEIRGERLPPVAADGRAVPLAEPRRGEIARFDAAFAAAANAIAIESGVSPVVRSSYGFHVILLEQKLPERKPSIEERRTLVKAHLVDERARVLLESEIQRLRAETAVEVTRAADTLTAGIEGLPKRGDVSR